MRLEGVCLAAIYQERGSREDYTNKPDGFSLQVFPTFCATLNPTLSTLPEREEADFSMLMETNT